MSVWLRHIICAMVLIWGTCVAQAQDSTGIDGLLERYERSCEECLNLRSRVDKGEKIPKAQAEDMVQKFINLNRLLKDIESELSSSQKARFEAIGNWFRTGNKPLALNYIPLEKVTADLPEAEIISLPSPSVLTELQGQLIYIPLEKRSVFILPSFSLSPSSFGAMAGVQHGRWGGYARYTGRFDNATPSYSCSDEGILENGSFVWPNGERTEKTFQITAGPVFGLNYRFDIYAGLGYGRHQVLWQDIDGNWVAVGQGLRGICAETGVLASWKSLTFGAGISTISFRTLTPTLSLGVNF